MSPQSDLTVGVEIAFKAEPQDHTHYAGRGVAGVTKPITLAKKGIRQVRLNVFAITNVKLNH